MPCTLGLDKNTKTAESLIKIVQFYVPESRFITNISLSCQYLLPVCIERLQLCLYCEQSGVCFCTLLGSNGAVTVMTFIWDVFVVCPSAILSF